MMPATRFEQDYIISVLEQHDGRVRDAAGYSDPADKPLSKLRRMKLLASSRAAEGRSTKPLRPDVSLATERHVIDVSPAGENLDWKRRNSCSRRKPVHRCDWIACSSTKEPDTAAIAALRKRRPAYAPACRSVVATEQRYPDCGDGRRNVQRMLAAVFAMPAMAAVSAPLVLLQAIQRTA